MAELNSYAHEIFVLLVIFKFLGFVPWCVDAKHESGLRHFKIGAHQVLKCFATNVALFALIIYSVISEYHFKQVTSYPIYVRFIFEIFGLLLCHVIFTQDEKLMVSSFANKIVAMCSILQRLLPYTLPILTAMQSPNMVSFLNLWNKLQV